MIVNLAGELPPSEYRVRIYPLDGEQDFVVLVPGKEKLEPGAMPDLVLPFLQGGQWTWVTGRGPLYSMGKNPKPEWWEPGMMNGEWMLIEGGLYQIRGVETWAIHRSPSWPYGDQSLGLLVNDRTDLPADYYARRMLDKAWGTWSTATVKAPA